jgi:hypothetical protein
VIRAGKELGVAAVGTAYPVATVATEVQEGAETPAQIAAQDNRLFSHIRRNEVAGMGHLAFVAKVEPTASEEMFTFSLVDLPVGKNAPIYQTAFWIDKRLDLHPDAPSVVTFSTKEVYGIVSNPLFHYFVIPLLTF